MKKELSVRDIYEAARRHFGPSVQLHVGVEELCECAAALSGFLADRRDDSHAIEEIADAAIMLEQLTLYFGEDAVDLARRIKLRRLAIMVGLISDSDQLAILDPPRSSSTENI